MDKKTASLLLAMGLSPIIQDWREDPPKKPKHLKENPQKEYSEWELDQLPDQERHSERGGD